VKKRPPSEIQFPEIPKRGATPEEYDEFIIAHYHTAEKILKNFNNSKQTDTDSQLLVKNALAHVKNLATVSRHNLPEECRKDLIDLRKGYKLIIMTKVAGKEYQ